MQYFCQDTEVWREWIFLEGIDEERLVEVGKEKSGEVRSRDKTTSLQPPTLIRSQILTTVPLFYPTFCFRSCLFSSPFFGDNYHTLCSFSLAFRCILSTSDISLMQMAVDLQRWGKVLTAFWWSLTLLFSDPVGCKGKLPECVWYDALLRNLTPCQHAVTFTFIGFFPWTSHDQRLTTVENCATTNCFSTFLLTKPEE